jgi:hypothetical protein
MIGGDADKSFDPTGLSEEEVQILEAEGSDEESSAPEEVAPEAPKAETPKPKPHEDPNRPKDFVPVQALREARNELKETQKRLREFEGFQREIAAKLLAERQSQAQPEPELPPNPDENPFQTLKWVQQQLLQQQEQAKLMEQQTQQQLQEQERMNAFRTEVAQEFDEAAAEDTDLQEAFQYLQGAFKYEYDNVYARTGIPFEQYQADTILNHSIFARNSGVPIAEYVRNLAVARGWSPGVLRNNAAAVAAAGQKPTMPAAQRIEKIAQAQDRNASLGKSSGTDGGEITLETLSKMSGSQLEKFAAKNPQIFEKLTGIPA